MLASAVAALPSFALGDDLPPPTGVVHMPIELTRNQLWTPVWLDGKGPYRFAIDTGTAYFSIQARLAAEAGLHTASRRTRLITHVNGKEEDYWSAYYADNTVLGGALAEKNILFQAEPSLNGFIQGRASGAILLTSPTVVDFAERTIDFYMKGRPDTADYDRLPMTPLEPGNLEPIRQLDGADAALVVDVEWMGEPLKIQVRTAADTGLFLYAHAVERLAAWDKFPKWAPENGRWGESVTYWRKIVHLPYKARAVRAGPLTIGSAVLKDPVVTMVDPTEVDHVDDGQRQPIWSVGNRRLQVDGFIGMETLRRFSFIVDADQRAFWTKPNAALNQPFRYNRSGMRYKAADGQLVVSSVRADGPAATAGVQVGDVVLGKGESAPPPALGWMLGDGPGTVVEFDAVRNNTRVPIRMVLRDLI